jgi:hypothetical protein
LQSQISAPSSSRKHTHASPFDAPSQVASTVVQALPSCSEPVQGVMSAGFDLAHAYGELVQSHDEHTQLVMQSQLREPLSPSPHTRFGQA